MNNNEICKEQLNNPEIKKGFKNYNNINLHINKCIRDSLTKEEYELLKRFRKSYNKCLDNEKDEIVTFFNHYEFETDKNKLNAILTKSFIDKCSKLLKKMKQLIKNYEKKHTTNKIKTQKKSTTLKVKNKKQV